MGKSRGPVPLQTLLDFLPGLGENHTDFKKDILIMPNNQWLKKTGGFGIWNYCSKCPGFTALAG